MLRLKVSSLDHILLDDTCKNLVDKCITSGHVVKGPVPLKSKRKRWTLLSSPFVHKRSRVQLKATWHYRLLEVVEEADALRSFSIIMEEVFVDPQVSVELKQCEVRS